MRWLPGAAADELTEYYRRLIRIRKNWPALTSSIVHTLVAEGGIYAFERLPPVADRDAGSGPRIVVILNNEDSPGPYGFRLPATLARWKSSFPAAGCGLTAVSSRSHWGRSVGRFSLLLLLVFATFAPPPGAAPYRADSATMTVPRGRCIRGARALRRFLHRRASAVASVSL